MRITFSNDYAKKFHARKGPPKIFGKDVDDREKMSDADAIERFDTVWERYLEWAVGDAEGCDVDFVRSKVTDKVAARISPKAEHREFMLANCFFICQLPHSTTCDELWFIPSASGDPRLLYVKFENVPLQRRSTRWHVVWAETSQKSWAKRCCSTSWNPDEEDVSNRVPGPAMEATAGTGECGCITPWAGEPA